MLVTVNGEACALPAGATIASIVAELAHALGGRGIAVALEGEVVPRGEWSRRRLNEGARVEVVAAVQGG